MSESFRHLWGRTDKATPPTPDPRERGEAVPSFWAVLRDDNEMMATGKTHDEAVREFMRLRGGDYANAVKEGYRCVAVFTNWPALRAPAPSEAGAWPDPEQPSRVAHAILLGAEGLPPKDYARLARAYLALRVPAAPVSGERVAFAPSYMLMTEEEAKRDPNAEMMVRVRISADTMLDGDVISAAPSGGSEVSEVQLSGGRAILYDGLDTRCWWFRDADGELSGQSATLSDLLSAYDLVGELTDAQFIALAALRAGGPTHG